MDYNYFGIIEKISGRLDKLCKRGVIKNYRAATGRSGYSLVIEDDTGNVSKFQVDGNGVQFKDVRAELRRLEKQGA